MAIYEEKVVDGLGVNESAKAEVINHIHISSQIPPDAKASLAEYVENFWDDASQIVIDKLPPELADYGDILNNIINQVLG